MRIKQRIYSHRKHRIIYKYIVGKIQSHETEKREYTKERCVSEKGNVQLGRKNVMAKSNGENENIWDISYVALEMFILKRPILSVVNISQVDKEKQLTHKLFMASMRMEPMDHLVLGSCDDTIGVWCIVTDMFVVHRYW